MKIPALYLDASLISCEGCSLLLALCLGRAVVRVIHHSLNMITGGFGDTHCTDYLQALAPQGDGSSLSTYILPSSVYNLRVATGPGCEVELGSSWTLEVLRNFPARKGGLLFSEVKTGQGQSLRSELLAMR